MSITPQPGWIVDPTNSNGVVRDTQVDANGMPTTSRNTTPTGGALSSTGPISAPPAQYLDPATGRQLPVGSPQPGPQHGPTPGVPRITNIAPGYYQSPEGLILPVNPPAGFHRTSTGEVIQDAAPISRMITNPGTTQNVGIPGASNDTPVSRSTVGMSQEEIDAERYLDTSFEKPKTRDEIIAERTLQSRGRIDAAKEFAATQRANLAPLTEMRSREANAQAVLRGLSGSSEAGTLAETATKRNINDQNAIAAEENMKLMDIYSGIQDFADRESIRQKEVASGTAKDILQRGVTARKEALTHLETIAKLPAFDLEKMKTEDPNTYNALAQSVGGEAQMRSIVSYSRPVSSLVGTPTIIGNQFVHTTVKNPDGTTTNEYTPLPPEVIAAIKAGQIPELVPTANGTIVSYNGGKSLTSLSNLFKNPVVPRTTIRISRDVITMGDQKLSATRGPDGYVDPNAYQTAFNDWVNGSDTHNPIGTAKEFLANFPPKNYVNPANTWLPTYLMPAGAKKGTTTAKARF